jgi:hypothetical protein
MRLHHKLEPSLSVCNGCMATCHVLVALCIVHCGHPRIVNSSCLAAALLAWQQCGTLMAHQGHDVPPATALRMCNLRTAAPSCRIRMCSSPCRPWQHRHLCYCHQFFSPLLHSCCLPARWHHQQHCSSNQGGYQEQPHGSRGLGHCLQLHRPLQVGPWMLRTTWLPWTASPATGSSAPPCNA